MKVVIPGGTGQVGTLLARTFHRQGHDVIVLSRAPHPTPWRQVAWDSASIGPWVVELEHADVVINLAGRSVNCRYTPRNRKVILESRVRSTQVIGTAIARAAHPPKLWLQASTATIYAHRYDASNDERFGLIGGTEDDVPDTWRFSVDVALAWEQAAQARVRPHTRLVLLRSAMTMSPDRDGIFDVLLGLVRVGLGGSVGGGQQYVSWIHDQDFIRAITWLIEHDELAGAINLAAPVPLPQAEFMRILRAAWGMPLGLPATTWMAEIGALALGTETELILKSRRVTPGRLLQSGFDFQFPTWEAATQDLCQRWRMHHRTTTRQSTEK
jgi:uncharacterized protein (TIGR01777 family)